ncbi:hypothetical protein GEMRC1_004959 [Eukaryota sp. GEM-RC1]
MRKALVQIQTDCFSLMEPDTPSFQQTGPPHHSCCSRGVRQPSSLRPPQEVYELPPEAPFTAKIDNVAHSTTKDHIKHAFSSLPVKEVRSSSNVSGRFFVEFLDVQGLKQCLDQFWMFEINGRPIHPYVASVPRSSAMDDDDCRGATLPSPTSLQESSTSSSDDELLPFTSSFPSPSSFLQFQQSLLILIYLHLLSRLCKMSLDISYGYPLRSLLDFKKQMHKFFEKYGHVSNHLFESSILAVKVLFQTNTFPVNPKELHQLCSFASFFGADVQNVFPAR